jgi:hypothetical protein
MCVWRTACWNPGAPSSLEGLYRGVREMVCCLLGAAVWLCACVNCHSVAALQMTANALLCEGVLQDFCTLYVRWKFLVLSACHFLGGGGWYFGQV